VDHDERLGEGVLGVPVAMAVLGGVDYAIVAANDEFWRLTGRTPRVGVPLAEVLPGLSAGAHLAVPDRVRATGERAADLGIAVRPSGPGATFVDLLYVPVDAASERILVVATDATQRTQNAHRLERTLDLLTGQKNVLERLISGAPLASVLDSLVRLVEAWSDDDVVGSVLLMDEDGVHLRHGSAPSLPEDYIGYIDGLRIGPNAGSCGTAAYRRTRVIAEDIGVDPLWADYRDAALAAGLRACWSTPIMDGAGHLLGTFAMYYRQPGRPADVDLQLVDLLAGTAGVAISWSRGEQLRRRAVADLNFVLELTTRMSESLDRDETLKILADMAVPTLADICVVDLAEDAGIKRAVVAADPPERRVLAAQLTRYPPDPSGGHPAARVLATGRAELAAEVSDDLLRSVCTSEEHYRIVAGLGYESFMAVPLVARGRTFGALTLISAGSGRRYGERDLAVAEELSRRVALTIDNIGVYQAARDAQRRLSLVVQAGVALTSSLDVETVVERFGTLLADNVGEVCEIHIKRSDGLWWRRRFPEPGAGTLVQAAGLPARVAEAIEARRMVRVPGDAAGVFADGQPADTDAAVVLPLLARGTPVGAVALAADSRSRSRLGLEVLEVLSGRAALAFDNAALYEQHRTAAQVLQRGLLPQRLPCVAGIQVAARYAPATLDVGGDWYDILPYPDGRTGIVVGDVMGRGIGAASTMGRLRWSLRAFAEQGLEPAEALRLLNRLLRGEDAAVLATVLYGVIDAAATSVTFANAGQCPPLHVTGRGAGYADIAPDPPLGVIADGTYRHSALPLDRGQLLTLFTDGLVESRSRPIDVGLAELLDATGGADPCDPDAFCDHLLKSMRKDGDEDDDVTVLAIRVT
jgi:serine phosphatase RsbU (regulator of sigma subunit)